MNINDYYKSLNKKLTKVGHLRYNSNQVDQPYHLKKIVTDFNVKNIMEIGFNAGHSADLFLNTDKNVKLTSFDLGEMESVLYGKSFIDFKYPFRHNLIIGDSKTTVPKFSKNTDFKFDLIFIDGGHEFIDAITDIVNCKALAHKSTVLVLDDTRYSPPFKSWTIGPTKAWESCIEKGYISEICRFDYIDKNFPWKGQSWGHYTNVE